MMTQLEAERYFLQRRRWARVGVTYVLMLIFMMIFLSPLLFSVLSSFKVDPMEYPPDLSIPQLNPLNWKDAGKLSAEAGGSIFTGGFSRDHSMGFSIEYFVEEGRNREIPRVSIPRRVAGAGLAAVKKQTFAADYLTVSSVSESAVTAGSLTDDQGVPRKGLFVTYSITIEYADGEGERPFLKRIPLDVLAPSGQEYVKSSIPASRLERRGRVASFNNISPGVLGYAFYNYGRVFGETESLSTGKNLFGTWMMNSFIVAFSRVALNLVLASMAGYALARFRFRGRSTVFMLLIMSQVLPAQVLFISNYLIMRDGLFGLTKFFGMENLLNTLPAVVIVSAVESAKVFIMKQFFESIPLSIEEAAHIDGAGHFATFFRIILPMSRPALGAVAILTFQGSWNDFFWPMIVLTTPEDVRTLPIGILYFRQLYGAAGDWALILSGAVLSALPVIILYIVFQKYFLQGVSFGGTKG